MKNKLWLFQLPVVALFTFAFYIMEAGVQGDLHSHFMRETLFPIARSVQGTFTNLKFRLRGSRPVQNKVVIVEIDSNSIAQVGRWPWHRDWMAALIDRTFESGAKVVGLDIVFSEPDTRVSPELAELLRQRNLDKMIPQFETDFQLEAAIAKYRDRLILGWSTEYLCQPAYATPAECPITDPEVIGYYPKAFEKFRYSVFNAPAGFDQSKSPLLSIPDFIANLDMYNAVAKHAGYFNTFPDPDGYIRRTNLVMTANGIPYPALGLEMARVVLNEDLEITLDKNQRVESIGFAKSQRKLPVSPLGVMEINFRGEGFTFPYVSAIDLLQDKAEVAVSRDRKVASEPKANILKDAVVLIGVSAQGLHDMRAFPFDSNVPGVEGHATILDNILAGDALHAGNGMANSRVWLFLLMTAGALLFAYATQKLESIPALLLFITVIGGFTLVDLKLLFANNVHWDTSFLYIELFVIFIFTLAVKYVLEERNKKFIRGAFSKYVAPTIVDSILKDPTKLSVGGEKRELTILFSDIRGFTSFSETMDAKALAKFLNDYLGIMTDIVFEHHGTLDKYIGDAVMAFWGAPLDQPMHAANACNAAVAMQKALSEHRERFKAQYGVTVNIGVGLNTGAVNVGNMGSERIFEYTVIGDHVNLASRLEGLTKAYGAGIVTTRFTLDSIKQVGEVMPPHRVLDFVKVKGKKNAVELIHVLEADYPAQAIKTFEEARQLYTKQQWDQAIEAFAEANRLTQEALKKDDGTALMYVDRCKEFKQTPPNSDWDGSWEMHSK